MDLNAFASSTVTVGELLKTQEDLERQAAEVLGFDIDTCTHSKGSICQSVYACLTCRGEGEERSGVLSCHTEHNIVELLQRRDFICDCGTTQLGEEAECKLDKRYAQDPNTSNRYDHNFDGRFCSCNSLYDAEQEESDMYQCIVCEDWFHAQCEAPELKLPEDEWDAYICRACVDGPAAPILRRWAGVGQRGVLLIREDGSVQGRLCDAVKRAASASPEPAAKKAKLEHAEEHAGDIVIPAALIVQPPPLAAISSKKQCTAPPASAAKSIKGPILLEEGWRDRWCRCNECLPSFDGLQMLLVPDEIFEPAADPDAKKSLVELGMKALQDLPREQVIEGLHRYNQMRDGLLKHLAPLSASGSVVTKADVERFFEEQRARDAQA